MATRLPPQEDRFSNVLRHSLLDWKHGYAVNKAAASPISESQKDCNFCCSKTLLLKYSNYYKNTRVVIYVKAPLSVNSTKLSQLDFALNHCYY